MKGRPYGSIDWGGRNESETNAEKRRSRMKGRRKARLWNEETPERKKKERNDTKTKRGEKEEVGGWEVSEGRTKAGKRRRD